MFISDPGSGILIFTQSRIPDLGSRIQDPKIATKERGKKKFDVIFFNVATNFTKLYIILVLKC
jgi:Na+-transporting NADH:ubiquinone oxidoreductase subunit NqrC